jgi:hypothetical protein
MAVVSRLKQNNLMISGGVSERLPPITNGLISHFPFDGRGGTFDKMSGYQSLQHIESSINLLEAMNLNWKDPNSWYHASGSGNVTWDESRQALKFTGSFEGYLKIPIIIDYTKHYLCKGTVYQESRSGTNAFYFGGYSALSDGTSFNGGSWDYSLCGGSQLAIGQWRSFSATRYSTTAYPAGWTGSKGTAVKHYFGGLFNYNCQNTTDVIYVKNISITVTDSDASGCIHTPEGLAVDNASTNLVPDAIHMSGWSSYDNGNDGTFITEFGTVGYKIINRSTWNGLLKSIVLPSAGTYTFSAWFKYIGGASANNGSTIYIAGWGGSDTAVVVDKSKVNQWQRVSLTLTTTTTTIQFYIISFGGTVPTDKSTWEVTMPQVEAGAFAHPFRNGTNGNGILTFPLQFSNNMTFVFRHKPYMPIASQTGQATSPNIFELGIYYTNASVTFWGWGGTIRTFFKGNSGTGWQAVPDNITMSNSEWLKEHHWALVFSGTSGWNTYKLYHNGELLSTTALNPVITSIYGNFYGFGTYGGCCPNAIYRDLSVYNRALSQDEIQKLFRNNKSLKSNGNIVTPKLTCHPIFPNNAIYFPLSVDAKDINHVYGPAEETNIIYEHGGAWVGSAVTNLINSRANGFPSYGNSHGTYNVNQYNANAYFSIGTISGVANNIVTLATIGHPIYTYDVLRPQTTGGGVTAGVDYFVKKISSNSFSLHVFDGSQDGSKGYAVHNSIYSDTRVAINATSFPTMWWGSPHNPNSALVKEIIHGGFNGHDCIRCHGEHKPEGDQDYMAYGVYPSVAAGSTYTFSFWARAANNRSIGKIIGLSLWTSGGWSTFSQIEGPASFPDTNWHRFAYRGVAPASGGTNLYFPFSKCGTIDIAEIQVEAHSFATPFTIISRAASSLEYNLYNSIGMNWAGNWTIIYWKKPIATETLNLTGYNIDSLGCNSNSVGGGYIWWGKQTAQDIIYAATPNTITPSSYFNNWHMISLSKSAATITIIEWGIGGQTCIRTAVSTTSVSNYYVTQYGYDLKLGGFDNGYPMNVYFKDLIIIPTTALTTTQLEEIYRMQLREKNGLQIQGKLMEGVVF